LSLTVPAIELHETGWHTVELRRVEAGAHRRPIPGSSERTSAIVGGAGSSSDHPFGHAEVDVAIMSATGVVVVRDGLLAARTRRPVLTVSLEVTRTIPMTTSTASTAATATRLITAI
jgi:hypothetical protein